MVSKVVRVVGTRSGVCAASRPTLHYAEAKLLLLLLQGSGVRGQGPKQNYYYYYYYYYSGC